MGCLSFVARAAEVEARGSTVFVNEIPVFSLKTAAYGLTPDIQAEMIASALDAIEFPKLVEVRQAGAEYLVLVQGFQIATATKAEAVRHGTTPEALAKSWAGKLERALSMPPLKLGANEAKVPLGDAKMISLTGHAARVAKIESTNPGIVEAERTPEGIRLRGKGIGEATVVVRSGEHSEMLDVRVRPWAATLPKALRAEVTGSPASGTAVRGSISYALYTFVPTLPGAEIAFTMPSAGAIGQTETKSYPVRVRVTARDSFDAVGTVQVTVANAQLSKMADTELWYCNAPEIVRRAEPLFAANLREEKPARLLYHHVNGASTPLLIRVQAINNSDVPAKVRVQIGDARPDKDPVRAGLDAASNYLQSWMSGSGEMLVIPPKSSIPIALRRLSPGETMSGLASLRLVSGEGVLVRADSWPPFELDERWQSAEASMTPWREVGANPITILDTGPYEPSLQIYPQPYKAETLNYQVGGRYGFVRIGQKPIGRDDTLQRLDGNFGVIYDIKTSIQNPTAHAADVEVVFEASAGYSGGLFVVNGLLHRTKLLRPKQEAQIAKVHMVPGAQRLMSIMTMPLSGSSYPATITVRPVGL